MNWRTPLLGLLTTALFSTASAQAVPVAQAPNPSATQPAPETPAPTPPAFEQPAASAPTLRLQDLPAGFQEVPPQIKQRIVPWLEPFKQLLGRANLPLNNFFAFVNLEKFEVVFGSTGLLPNQPLALATFDTAVHQLQRTTARQQQISKFRERLQAILGIELVEYSALPELNNLADASMGMSLALLLRGQPMRADVAGFRRNTVGAFTAVLYLDDKPPLAPLSNLVSKLDNRIKQSSSSANKSCKRPIPKSTSQKSCNTNNGASKVSKLLGSEESEGGSRGLGKFKISLLPTPEPKPVLHKESAGNVDLFMSHAFIPLHGAFLQWNNFFVTPSYPLSQALTNQRLHQNIACHSAMVLHAKAVQNRTDFILTPTAWSWLLGSIAPNTHFPIPGSPHRRG